MSNPTARPPDLRLVVRTRDGFGNLTEARGRVGCGWSNPDGSVSIKLDPGTELRWDDNLVIALFPMKPGER